MENINLQEFISTKIPLMGNLEVTMMTLIVILIAILLIKGSALFRAARKNDRGWFWVMLILNTAGILPLLYLTVFSKR